MKLIEVSFGGGLPIDGYGPGFFRVAGEVREAPFVLLPSGVHRWTGFDDITLLLERADEIDVLFVGTGAEPAYVPKPFREALENGGLGVETMASPQAARTYNVLLSEGRRVGVALLPV